METITRAQAETVLLAVRLWGVTRGVEPDTFQLFDGQDHEGLSAGSWVINGEGAGFDWATYLAEYPTSVTPSDSGIFLEPVRYTCLGLYSAE